MVEYDDSDAPKQQGWQQISVVTDELSSHILGQLFSDLGALSVTLSDAANEDLYEPPPGTTPLWSHTRVIALFDMDANLHAVKQSVSDQMPRANLDKWQIEVLEDRVWERVWLEHFHPMQFGERLWVCPTGHAPPEDASTCLILDPGLAFGTGTHPTTALCLEWLAQSDLTGLQVVDFGCGSGILAIAAVLLGAHKVFAVDIDDQALIATQSNALKNGVDGRVQVCTADGLPTIQADIVIANILARPLCDLAGKIRSLIRPNGRLVLSGILEDQIEHVVAAYVDDIAFEKHKSRDNWARLNGVKRSLI